MRGWHLVSVSVRASGCGRQAGPAATARVIDPARPGWPAATALTGLALAHGYDTAFWWTAGIFAAGAVIGGGAPSGDLPTRSDTQGGLLAAPQADSITVIR